MIAELAAANAAFGVIKEALAHGKELYEAGEAIADYFGLKSQIQKKAHEHGYKSDIQAFMAAEQLKEQEEALKNMLIWQGRPGQWDRWLEHQKAMKESRDAEAKEIASKKLARRKAIKNGLLITGVVLGVFTAVGAIGFMVYWLVSVRGR